MMNRGLLTFSRRPSLRMTNKPLPAFVGAVDSEVLASTTSIPMYLLAVDGSSFAWASKSPAPGRWGDPLPPSDALDRVPSLHRLRKRPPAADPPGLWIREIRSAART